MNRRKFLQAMGMCGLGLGSVRAFGLPGIPLSNTLAGVIASDVAGQLSYHSVGSNFPQIINIFLYGGPSELAGNLSNIGDIMLNSQNPYPAVFDPNNASTIVTPNSFWNGAGGDVMEKLLASADMTIYRTLNRTPETDTKAHGNCVTTNLVGNADESNPGIATTLAWLINQQAANGNINFGKAVEELLFPIVTFEGESQAFNTGSLTIPIGMKAVSLNSNLQNPYQRSNISGASYLNSGGSIDLAIESLANSIAANSPYTKIMEAFNKRADLAAQIATTLDPAAVDAAIADYNTRLPVDAQIAYANNNFGNRLKAAVSLALANRDSLFISLGSGGLGGWDDHGEALNDYPDRMQNLMNAIDAAITHMNAASGDSVNPITHADKIIINVYGDFGRNVNLNNSMGWDHGNNQNLYTFAGKGLTGRQLGKIVGATHRIGDSGVNRQFTTPNSTSYQCSPFAVASTMFSYFGLDNPELLTGVDAIDETITSETII